MKNILYQYIFSEAKLLNHGVLLERDYMQIDEVKLIESLKEEINNEPRMQVMYCMLRRQDDPTDVLIMILRSMSEAIKTQNDMLIKFAQNTPMNRFPEYHKP